MAFASKAFNFETPISQVIPIFRAVEDRFYYKNGGPCWYYIHGFRGYLGNVRKMIKSAMIHFLRDRFTLSEAGRSWLHGICSKPFEHDLAQGSFTVHHSSFQEDFISHASGVLGELGVIVIDGLIATEDAKRAGEEFRRFYESEKGRLSTNNYVETETYLAQTDLTFLKSYTEMAGYHKPVINIRSRDPSKPDGGMVDVFNFQFLAARFPYLYDCYKKLRNGPTRAIINHQSQTTMTEGTLNLYYNDSITSPRQLHTDTLGERYKAFLYLTDVPSNEYGPYSYVPRSHRKLNYLKRSRRLNVFFKNTLAGDIHIRSDLAVPIYGGAGTVIVSNQSGVHGGLPQIQGRHRIMIVDNYHKSSASTE